MADLRVSAQEPRIEDVDHVALDLPAQRQIVVEPVIDLPAHAPSTIVHHPKSNLVWWSFSLLVLLPTAVFGAYLFFVASDQYVAEARFAVRPVDPIVGVDSSFGSTVDTKGKFSSSGSYLSGGDNLTGEDAAIVASYIHSRSIVDDVARRIDLRAAFQAPGADRLARLPDNASAEDLTAYWNRMVSVYTETSSGIVTVSVSAFRRDDALAIAQAVLKSSEALVNALSRKVRADAMRTAEDEVRRNDGEVRFALANLTSFRNAHRLIDPIQSSDASTKLLLQLMSDRIETEAKLFVIQRSQGLNAPGITGVRAKLDSINRHVAELKEQMAGTKAISTNLAATLAKFENLELQKQFAERMYGFAREGVERARVAAIRQSVYLAVFMPPALPQDYTYPLRTTDFLLFGGACLMIWICGMTVTASILDHRL